MCSELPKIHQNDMTIFLPPEKVRKISRLLTFSGDIEMVMPFLRFYCQFGIYPSYIRSANSFLTLTKYMTTELPFSPAELCKTLNFIFFDLSLFVLMKYFSSTFARVSCSRAKLLFSLSPSKYMKQLNFSMLSNLARTENEMVRYPAGIYMFKVSN